METITEKRALKWREILAITFMSIMLVISSVMSILSLTKQPVYTISLTRNNYIIENNFTIITLEESDVVFIYLKYVVPEVETDFLTYNGLKSVKYNEAFLLLEASDTEMYFNMNEIIVWGINR